MKKIWIIEDNKDLAELMQAGISYFDYEITIFHTAAEGLKSAEKITPDMIIIDIMLPGMNGADMVTLIKKQPSLAQIPILFLTGLVSEKEQDRGITVDGKVYRALAKPFEISLLVRIIKEMVHGN